nr:DUF1576 domain-containing protein [Clostridium sp. Marseille-P299]
MLSGLYKIIIEPDILITDYFEVGGIGAAFVNSGLLMLISVLILFILKVEITGITIASVFLMGSFALFGKNIVNVWPIILGVYLYSKVCKEKFADHIYAAFFSTSISPIVTELLFVSNYPLWIRIIKTLVIGISIGFCVPPVSKHLFHVHKGFSLYNTGFAVGIIGTVFVSFFKSIGYDPRNRLLWSSGNDVYLGTWLIIIFTCLFIAGYFLSGKSLENLKNIFTYSGQLSSDFVALEGFGSVLMNMGLNGFLAMAYVLIVGGPLNGPTIGGILTVVGFGSFGKHCRNIFPIFLGVLLGGILNLWELNNPSILLAALFGTSLAPIAGRFGFIWGIVAVIINSAVVLNLSVLHGGMNLYNTGFSAGIVSAFMVPILNTFYEKNIVSKNNLI